MCVCVSSSTSLTGCNGSSLALLCSSCVCCVPRYACVWPKVCMSDTPTLTCNTHLTFHTGYCKLHIYGTLQTEQYTLHTQHSINCKLQTAHIALHTQHYSFHTDFLKANVFVLPIFLFESFAPKKWAKIRQHFLKNYLKKVKQW